MTTSFLSRRASGADGEYRARRLPHDVLRRRSEEQETGRGPSLHAEHDRSLSCSAATRRSPCSALPIVTISRIGQWGDLARALAKLTRVVDGEETPIGREVAEVIRAPLCPKG